MEKKNKPTFRVRLKRKLKFWRKMIFNWRFLICFGTGWMITNGWSYVTLGIGVYWGIPWMVTVAGAYLTFLWLPFTPEKIVTVAIALFLVRMLFPRHYHEIKGHMEESQV